MIRRSPCEQYIKFLLVHQDAYSDDAVIDLLRLKQLDFLGPSYLQRLRRDLRPPSPFRPHDRFHGPSRRFLETYKLYYCFYPDEAMAQALSILESPQGKELIESMLLTDDPDALVVYRMQAQGLKCSTTTVERYRFFFFNTALVDSTELRALLQLRMEFVDINADAYDEQMRKVMVKASYRDPRVSIARHPTKQIAGLLNQMRLGYLPSQLQLQRIMKAAQAAAISQSFTAAQIGGKGGAVDARDYALSAKILGELMKEMTSADDDLQRDLQALALKTSNEPVPYIAELTGGNHTVDMSPLGASAVVEEQDVE